MVKTIDQVRSIVLTDKYVGKIETIEPSFQN